MDGDMKYELIQDNLDDPESFIWSVMHKKGYANAIRNWNFMDEGDLVQEGWIALLQAAKNYNKEFNKDFGWYAFYWVNQRLGKVVNDNIEKERHETSWEQNYEIEDIEEEPTRLDKVVEKMPEEDQEIIELAKEGYTHKEISERLDIPRQTITYRLNNLSNRIKK